MFSCQRHSPSKVLRRHSPTKHSCRVQASPSFRDCACSIFQSNLPIRFWGKCVKTAVYIINRIPLSSINNLSPYEKLYGHKPNNSHFRAFGCLCFVNTPKQARLKFHSRANESIFIGYVLGQKAYKTYNPSTNKVIISRDVSFKEHHFPYHFNTPSHSSFSKFYLPTFTPLPSYDEVAFPSSSNPSLPPFVPLDSSCSSSDITFANSYTLDASDPTSPSSSTLDDSASQNLPSPSHHPSLVIDLSLPPTHLSDPFPPSQLPPLSNSQPTPNVPTRKSTRSSKAPSHLKDFVCSNVHWCNLVAFDSLSCSAQ